jgi:hypothetical protein
MRRSILRCVALCATACLLVPHASAADRRYEDREDEALRAFLEDRLAQAKGQPICFKSSLLAVSPDHIAYLRNGPPEASTTASRSYSHDLIIWKNAPRRVLGEERQLSIQSDGWKALNARHATYGECAGRRLTLHRIAIARSTAMIFGTEGDRCGSTTFGANVRSSGGRWRPIHWKGYYATSAPPGCSQLPLQPELAAMTGYVMVGEKP